MFFAFVRGTANHPLTVVKSLKISPPPSVSIVEHRPGRGGGRKRDIKIRRREVRDHKGKNIEFQKHARYVQKNNNFFPPYNRPPGAYADIKENAVFIRPTRCVCCFPHTGRNAPLNAARRPLMSDDAAGRGHNITYGTPGFN